MRNKTKKIMAVLLAGFLLCTGMNLPANAEEEEVTETAAEEETAANPAEDPPEIAISEHEVTAADDIVPFPEETADAVAAIAPEEISGPDPAEEQEAEPAAEPEQGLVLYRADTAAEMAAAVAALADSSDTRVVIYGTEEVPDGLNVEGQAVVYDDAVIVCLRRPEAVEETLAAAEEAGSAAVRDIRMQVCEEESFTPADGVLQDAQDGLAMHASDGSRLVALIDTGVNDLAAVSVNLTDDPDRDEHGHGTRMAEIILAASGNRASILSIKAFNDDGTASLANVYAAVKYAMEAHAGIINISASVPDSENTAALKELLQEAVAQGIIVVAAAGNAAADAGGFFPANVPGVLTAGARTETSNYGPCVDYYVSASSTSEAAAKLSGFAAAGNMTDNPELFSTHDQEEGEYVPHLPVADPADPLRLYVNDDCYTAPGCVVTKERSGMYNGHYITFFHAANASFLCYEENVPILDGASYVIDSWDVNPEDALLAAYAYGGGAFVDAQLAVWGVNREETLNRAYDWAAGLAGGAVSYRPQMTGPSVYLPGELLMFTDAGGRLSEYQYQVAGVELSGGDDLHQEDVSVSLSGNTLQVTVSEQAAEMPEKIRIRLKSTKANTAPHSNCSGGIAHSPGSQTLLFCGRVDVTPGETYAETEIEIRLGVHGQAELQKIDQERGAAPGQGDAGLSGAVFAVVNRRNGRTVEEITTDETGHAESSMLKWGDYELHEVSAPAGYRLNQDWKETFDIRADGLVCKVKDVPETVFRGGIEVNKLDADRFRDGKEPAGRPQGDGTLGGAEFTVWNISNNDIYYEGQWIPAGEAAEEENIVLKLTADENGHAETGREALPYGTYLVKETKAPEGYLDNNAWQAVIKIREDGHMYDAGRDNADPSGQMRDEVIRGGVRFRKTDAERQLPQAQGDASLAGAEISINNISENDVLAAGAWINPGQAAPEGGPHVDLLHGEPDPRSYAGMEKVMTLTTDETGQAHTESRCLPYGTYVAVETKPSQGYLLNTHWQAVFSVREDNMTLDLTDPQPAGEDTENRQLAEQVIRGDVRIVKEDRELAVLDIANPSQAIGGKKHQALRAGHLNDIVFSITNTSALSILADAGSLTEYQPGEFVCAITTHYDKTLGKYVAETEGKALPYGTYTIQETKTNNAYLLTDGTPRTFEIDREGEIVEADTLTHHEQQPGTPMRFRDQIKRGEFSFVKTMGYTTDRIQTLWVLENANTGERHVLLTDINGVYRSDEMPHSGKVNANDGLLKDLDSYETKIDLTAGLRDKSIHEECGLWFGLAEDGGMAAVDDSLGSLPYGQYILHEVRTDLNEGLELQQFKFSIVRNAAAVDLGTITDYGITLSTVARDGLSQEQTAAAGPQMKLIDQVRYHGVSDYGTYRLKTTLVYADSGETVTDDQGRELVRETEVELKKLSGTLEVEMVFDGAGLAGRDVVFFEELFNAEGERVSRHMDLDDSSQTIRVMGIHTTLKDTTPAGPNDGKVILTDTVSYSGLLPGRTYVMTGTLMDKAEGTPLPGCEPVSAEFIPAVYDGTVHVVFTLDREVLAEHPVVVAFESCTLNGREVAAHQDLNDIRQTVEFREPFLRTTASDSADGDHTLYPEGGARITDQVKYDGLEPGKTYVLKGSLHVRGENGEDLGPLTAAGGQPYEVVAELMPQHSSGTAEAVFEIDASGLLGKELVVFEELLADGQQIAAHADISDAGQTVTVAVRPEIRTLAGIGAAREKTIVRGGIITVFDEVRYTDLSPGSTYRLKGELHVRNAAGDGGIFTQDGIAVQAETEFMPAERTGVVTLGFTVNTDLLAADTELVVFEELYAGSELVASHCDISDASQTVTVTVPGPAETPGPGISTTAYAAADGYDNVGPDKDVVINDIIRFKDLKPGQTYEVRGVLHQKHPDGHDMGELLINGTAVSASRTFIPDKPDGATEVSFRFNAEGLNGYTVVAFETLLADGQVVCTHADISSAEQSVLISRSPRNVRRRVRWIHTGTGQGILLAGICGMAAGIMLVILLRKRMKLTGTKVKS
ncbi:MAG: VaFE repeat-containing surface-anchored protein [Solobacterium sp.]|nr:VaFE repeat-containing surface-anchored protein [Solobacterium sp.]